MFYLPDVGIFALFVGSLCVLFLSLPPDAKGGGAAFESLLLFLCFYLGIVSLAGWLIGVGTSLWTPQWPMLVFFALLPALPNPLKRRRIVAHTRRLWQTLRALPLLERALLGYLLFVFALTFVLTLAPPSGGDYDGLMYHLAAPQQYLQHGRIVELPYDHHTYFPFSMEMLYLLGLAWRGPVLAKLFHWLMLPLCCAALIAMGKRHLSLRAGLFAAVIFASLPVVQSEASTAYIDLGLCAFVLIAFMCFANWLQTDESRWLLWSGAFCGFCLGTKYLGALTFGFLGVWALVRMISARRVQLKPLLGFASLALLLGGCWYLRNALWTGNPVFPFAYGVFGGRGWNAQMAAAYSADQAKFGFGRGPMDWLFLPWRLSMTPLNALVTTPRGPVMYPQPAWPLSATPLSTGNSGAFELGLFAQSIIGPPLLALSAPLVFVKRKPQVVGLVLWSFAFFWLFWAATGQYLRYLLPAFALLCLACGWGIEKFLNRGALLKGTLWLCLGAWMIFVPALTLHNSASWLPVIAGQEAPEHYLSRTFAPYAAMQWASTHTPANSRVAVYGEPRCFYLRRDYFWADDAHNNLIDYTRVQNGADLVAALKAQRATHVLWNTQGAFGPPPQPMQDAIARGLLHQLFEQNACVVFQIVGAKP